MEPPPPLSAAPPTAAAASASPSLPPQQSHLNSVDSSPSSKHTNSAGDATPASPQPPKLRLMCSYGGHIIPRPHDKSLCYIGGTTRIIVIDRKESFSDIHHRLCKTFLNNEPFTLRYQLPSEDLDSLISVTTDEDFENMVEEYERLNYSGGSKPGRLRLFLFPKSSSIEQLLVETSSTKSDDWFLDALNGKASNVSGGFSDRGFSESSSVNCLLGLEDDFVGKAAIGGKDVEAQIDASKNGLNGNGNSLNHDVHSVPDSPMLETTSSFGSTSSSPSTATLPPVRVHFEDNQKMGGLVIEEQFQQMHVGVMGIGGNLNLQQKREGVGDFNATGVAAPPVLSGVPVVAGGEYANQVLSDDEKSDSGGNRKPEQAQQQAQIQLQQQQFPQFQQRQAGSVDLRSPDSVSSDGSVANPFFRHGQIVYQEPIVQIQSGNARVSADSVDLKNEDQKNSRVQMHPQVQEPYYVIPGQFEQNHHPQLHQQQQFVHANAHYINAGAVPISPYYPMYFSQQQYRPPHSAIEQQYPVYILPARAPQTYNIPMQQPGYGVMAPEKPPLAAMPPSAAYSRTQNVPVSRPDVGVVYMTAASASSSLGEVPSGQQQTQYVGYTQIHHPPQSLAPPSAANANYAYAFPESRLAEMYSQPLPPQLAAQYHTMTSAPTVVLPEASQQHRENIKQLKISRP